MFAAKLDHSVTSFEPESHNFAALNININEEYRYLIALNTDLKSLKKEEIFNLAKNSFLREKIKKNGQNGVKKVLKKW